MTPPWSALGRPLTAEVRAIAERLQGADFLTKQLTRKSRTGTGYHFQPRDGLDPEGAINVVLKTTFDAARRPLPDKQELLRRADLLDAWAGEDVPRSDDLLERMAALAESGAVAVGIWGLSWGMFMAVCSALSARALL